MADRISITIDVSKMDKTRIVPRTYTNKDNEEVTQKNYRMELVALREPKLLKSGDGWEMWKTHFIVQAPSEEERENKVKTPILGDGIVFKSKTAGGDDDDWGGM